MDFIKQFFFYYLFLQGSFAFAQQNMKPFPQHTTYYKGVIKPNHISQKEMDDSVQSFYTVWKERYINNDCGKGQFYIWFEKDRDTKKCVSEGQGYGMMIVALMAGFGDSSKIIYDGLYQYYKSHPSKKNAHLMSWAQDKNFKDEPTSATDGDLDIAYSLLLADAQWKSDGEINYIAEAREMINAIMKHEINHTYIFNFIK